MGNKFEVGKLYEPYNREFSPIRILRRTEKTIWVENDEENRWFMRIKHDEDGNEMATDSCVPLKWRDAFTYLT